MIAVQDPVRQKVIRGLRLDDVGAATKQYEVYGRTRIPLGPVSFPFPGNFLFLKYLPPIKKWGPYREMRETEWESLWNLLRLQGTKLTIAVTATWVERDGSLTPFPVKYPAQARSLKSALKEGLIEIANHGLTHCVLANGQFKPRYFSSNRKAHREFWDWIPWETQRRHLRESQQILQDYFETAIVTFVPPGNVFQEATVELAREAGIRTISCKTTTRLEKDMAFIGDEDLLTFHDREIALEGLGWLTQRLDQLDHRPLQFVRELGETLCARGTL